MSQSDDDEPMLRPDGHRYDAPESDETTVNKELGYAVLGLLVVVVLLVLIATGTVPIFPGRLEPAPDCRRQASVRRAPYSRSPASPRPGTM